MNDLDIGLYLIQRFLPVHALGLSSVVVALLMAWWIYKGCAHNKPLAWLFFATFLVLGLNREIIAFATIGGLGTVEWRRWASWANWIPVPVVWLVGYLMLRAVRAPQWAGLVIATGVVSGIYAGLWIIASP